MLFSQGLRKDISLMHFPFAVERHNKWRSLGDTPDRRDEWEAEWMGELAYAWSVKAGRGQVTAARRRSSRGSAPGGPDAIWFQRDYGGDSMLSGSRCALRTLVPVAGVLRGGHFDARVRHSAAPTPPSSASRSMRCCCGRSPTPPPVELVFVLGTPTDGGNSAKVRVIELVPPDYADFHRASTSRSASWRSHVRAANDGDGQGVRAGHRLWGSPVTANLFPILASLLAIGTVISHRRGEPGAVRR